MTPEEIQDKSLLRCTVKKSWHTAGRVIVAASYAIVALAIGAVMAYGALNILPKLYEIASAAVGYIVSVLVSIPLWMYGVAAIPMGIVGYSFLWCVARDLTEEDWKSDAANYFAAAVAAVVAVVVAVAVAVAAAVAGAVAGAVAVAAAVAGAVAVAAAVVVVVADDTTSMWYYVFRFCGAMWNHYVVKGGKKE